MLTVVLKVRPWASSVAITRELVRNTDLLNQKRREAQQSVFLQVLQMILKQAQVQEPTV